MENCNRCLCCDAIIPEGSQSCPNCLVSVGVHYLPSASRIAELLQADMEGRVILLPTKAQEQRLLVEAALGIRLLDWQVAYIWGESSYLMPGRGTGKTLAYTIRLCLSHGRPLHMYPAGEHWGIVDEDHGKAYHRIFRDCVRDTYSKLRLIGGLKLRTIYFHPIDAQEVRR